MKPIQLKMTAFGPYKDTEVINFHDLNEHRLFVISGKTGAGKTTIFDGICFALYGLASGEDRTETKAMRSQFADDSVQTTVELIFDIGERRFRVMRQIPYKKKGNKSETPARCELFEEKEQQYIPAVDRQMVTEVNEKIEHLLGFTHAQFSQIMMLPQGEFRKFLTSDTANKERIMRKIFKTEVYQQVVERLKDRKDQAHAAYLKEKQTGDALIHQISAKLPLRESMLFAELAADYPNSGVLTEGLLEEKAFYEQQAEQHSKDYAKLYSMHGELQKKLYAAYDLNKQFDKLNEKQTELQQLHRKSAEMEALKERLSMAQRAARLEDLERQMTADKKEAEQKAIDHQQAVASLVKADESLAGAIKHYEKQQEKEIERTQAKEEILRLRTLLPTVSGLAEQKKRLGTIKQQSSKLEILLKEKRQALVHLNEAAGISANEIIVLEQSLENYEETLEKLAEVTAAAKQFSMYKEQTAVLEKLTQQCETAEQHAQASLAQYKLLEKRWISNQAAVLAASLHEGDACPVCGSTEHPEKAAGDQQHVTKEQLDDCQNELSEKQQKFHAKQAEKQQAARLKEELQHVDIDHDYSKEQDELSQQVAQMKRNRQVLSKKKAAFADTQEKCSRQQEEIEHAERQYNEALRELEKQTALYDHALLSVPEDVRELQALKQQISNHEDMSKQLETAWKTVQQYLEDSKMEQAKWQSSEQFESRAALQANEKSMASEKLFQQRLKEEQFESVEQYGEVKLPYEQREEIQQQLQNFAQRLHTLTSAVSELSAMLAGKELQNTEDLEQQTAGLKTSYEEAFRKQNETLGFRQAAEQLHSEFVANASEQTALEKNYGKITHLYDVVRGQNRLKISFERFIQIEYLERIIQAANIRLHSLSNGQYELIRSDRQETRGKQSGLGIDVHDAYTGQTRDVKTLSGGEKFNASLCLALGMADAIQSFQGAIRMETMFIDEGFGALDEEAIQKAIDTLIALQQSGRMIGIISHIDEMKEAIPATLEVTKLKEGHSKTKFVFS